MTDEQPQEDRSFTTTIMTPTSLVFDGWVVLEARQLWADLRYRLGTDDRRSNISFGNPSVGCLLVAIPTREQPPAAPKDIDGLNIVTLEEYVFAVMEVLKAQEQLRTKITKQLDKTF